MKTVRLLNHTRGTLLCERCQIADNPFTRIRGLLGRKAISPDEGLLITPCPSVHMIGMKFAIDVLFLTRDDIVTDWVENLPAGFHWHVAKPRTGENGTTFGKPFAALELRAGAIAQSGVQIGDVITFQ